MFNGRYSSGPCLCCNRRSVGCHSKCNDYKEFRKKFEILRNGKLHDSSLYVLANKTENKKSLWATHRR